MASNRPGSMTINMDTTELSQALGALDALTTTVTTDKFLEPLVIGTHRHMANQFNLYMDAMAGTEKYKHVYEWGVPGPAGRLWKHELKGRGSNRLASWSWLASKKAIPTPRERAEDPEDNMHGVPREIVDKLSTKRYFFTWKAPVMEFNKTVHISPVDAEKLFIPTGGGNYVFADSATNPNPGGKASTGAFTEAWTYWWGTMAQQEMENNIERQIQAGTEGGIKQVLAGGRRRAVTVSINTFKDNDAAREYGRKWAEKNLTKYAEEFRARQMERIINEYASG